jgi:hypothetical protein
MAALCEAVMLLNDYNIAIIGHGVLSNADALRLALFGFFQR